jgi:hypothetical protein
LDPRNYLGQGHPDLVPTKIVDTTLLETASDDWYGDFQGSGIPEMAIGRLPASTTEEAAAMVAKIVRHEGASGTQDGVLVVADRPDVDNPFEDAAHDVVTLVAPWQRATELLRSGAGSDFKAQLLRALSAGPVVVDYLGHGSQGLWRGALEVLDIPALTNRDRLSLYLNMTCLNGFFHDVRGPSMAKALLAAPGAALAVWASSGVTEFAPQQLLNHKFLEVWLRDGKTLGEAAIAAKAAVTDPDVRRTWILFGDPSSGVAPHSWPSPPRLATRSGFGCSVASSSGPGGAAPWIVLPFILIFMQRVMRASRARER